MNQAQVEAITDRFKDKVVVSLDENDWRNMADDYKCAFVLKLANGMPFNLTGLSNVLTKVWNMENRVTFTELANNMALAKFKNKTDMQKIRDGGPWLCLGTFIVMHDWCPDLSPEEFEMNRLGVWAQLHNLPVGAALKDKAIGEKLAIYIGRFVKVSQSEIDGARKRYIRVRVEIDIDKPLITGFFLERLNRDPLWVTVKYERLPGSCLKCGKLNHETDGCNYTDEMEVARRQGDNSMKDVRSHAGGKLKEVVTERVPNEQTEGNRCDSDRNQWRIGAGLEESDTPRFRTGLEESEKVNDTPRIGVGLEDSEKVEHIIEETRGTLMEVEVLEERQIGVSGHNSFPEEQSDAKSRGLAVGQLLGQEIWNAKGIMEHTIPQPNKISGLDIEKAHSTSGVEVPVQYCDNGGERLMRKGEDQKRRKLSFGRFHPYRVSDCDLEAKKSDLTRSNGGGVSTIFEIPAAEGRSGGLVLMWTEDVEVDLNNLSSYHIDVEVRGLADYEFQLTLLYGRPRADDRMESWNLLRRLRRDSDMPWVVLGDFNEIMFSWEMKSKNTRPHWQMRNLRDCLEECGLVDLGFQGEVFTYSNRRKGEEEVKAWLDRAVANNGWRRLFPYALIKHVFANSSDHVPILLCVKRNKVMRHHRMNRFEPMWLRHEKFKEVVREFWLEVHEDPPIMDKLKHCMSRLASWSSREFGKVGKKINDLKTQIQNLREGPRTEDTMVAESRLLSELDEWLEREELWWKQRSRAEWLKNGDRNTSYFHAKASQRKKRNRIERLKNNIGELTEFESEIASIITSYFTNIFQSQVTKADTWSRNLALIPKLVTEEMNNMLMAPFSEGEVRRALSQMHPTKAPGLDGFSALFYQSNWSVVGEKVVREVLSCLNNACVNPEWNETLLVLVPKVKKVEKVEDLRPISLCNVIMKLVTKVLANRLKEVLPVIISQTQSAFIPGRLITDNILLAHEISHYIKGVSSQKSCYMSLKLDMSKAYDRIEWYFLERMMIALGFAEGWVGRVMECVKTVTYKVKINDRVSETIRPSRGLRQGDPISPYLFLICAEWLNYALGKYQELGLIRGVRLCRGAPLITHLMFADDCVFFLKAKHDSVDWVREILSRYEKISGQKVNYAKSEMVCSKNATEDLRNKFVEKLHLRAVDSHSKYLGLPLSFGNRKTWLFREIDKKVLRKIHDWKHKLLSGAGREVLIKSILQAIPIYAMSCFKIHVPLCARIAGAILRFWWNGSKSKGIHWLKAEEMFKERGLGGMGFRKIELMNISLLAKQGWRIMMEPDLLVSKVFKAKDPGYWLWLCAKVCNEEEFKRLLCGLWTCWKDRNELAHGKDGGKLDVLKRNLCWLIKECMEGVKDLCWWETNDWGGDQEPIIFCDGSFDPDKRRGGAGAILTSGKAINGVRASFIVNCWSPFEAELMALNLGMEMALEHNLSKVKFFTDSKEVLWAFNLGSWRLDVESSVINKGIRAFDDHPGWILGAIRRDSNVAADQIARKARIDSWQWSNSLAIPRCIAEFV
ncbi:hypothetical protein QQ045_033596 [Rhodiola kirilowii]